MSSKLQSVALTLAHGSLAHQSGRWRFRVSMILAYGKGGRDIMTSLWVGHRGTVQDHPGLSPSGDAEAILKAIRGTGTDENTLISILTERLHA